VAQHCERKKNLVAAREEREFVESVARRLRYKPAPSLNQAEWLRDIFRMLAPLQPRLRRTRPARCMIASNAETWNRWMIGHLMICNEGPIQMSGRHDQVMAAFNKAKANAPPTKWTWHSPVGTNCVMGTHPNVEMKRQGSRPSRTHEGASDRS
jgi:hypothetical protein